MTRKDAIKAALKDAGINQTALAEMLGFATQSAVANCVARNISMDKFEQIMDLIGFETIIRPKCKGTLPGEYKIGGEEEGLQDSPKKKRKTFDKETTKKLVECMHNQDSLDMLDAFHSLDEQRRKIVADLIRGLAEL